MPSIKRKPIIYHPLPSLSSILQPLPPMPAQPLSNPLSTSTSTPPPSSPSSQIPNPHLSNPIPPDAETDEAQQTLLFQVLEGKYPGVSLTYPGERKAGRKSLVGRPPKEYHPRKSIGRSGDGEIGNGEGITLSRVMGGHVGGGGVWIPPTTVPISTPPLYTNGNGHGGIPITATLNGHDPITTHNTPPIDTVDNESTNGEVDVKYWKVFDRDCWAIPQTGEVFTDYESYAARITFYQQPIFMCDVTGKQNLSYFTAHASEQKEARQLHSRFPKQLKKAVLTSVQFQIEGKLEALADKVHDRFVNRFFDDERVFINVQGDKYLARIIKTFPPRSLIPHPSSSQTHPYGMDLNLTQEELLDRGDDPAGYIYNVRLIEEGKEGVVAGEAEEGNESWGGSVMEVQADKISRDRLNYSRIMLKRYIRDCVHRDPAVYSPWLLKPSIARYYTLPLEMSEEVRQRVSGYRERQMDKRKREREERLGLGLGEEVEEVVEEKERPKGKKMKVKKEREDDTMEVVEEIKKRIVKFPAEDLLVGYSVEKDGGAGRIEVRPSPNRTLPFGDQFEKFLMSWSFLNVMGKPLGLSPFTLDDYEQSFYHSDATSSSPLMVEIHSTLLNALINDAKTNPENLKPLGSSSSDSDETDYWEGTKGATTDTIRPLASSLASTWKSQPLPSSNRKGWESTLIGCLWDRATLTTLPNYLDNILHLTFEDKPVPTRPTWSTGPSGSVGSVGGLIQSKPEKRYPSLHHSYKLGIVSWLCEAVGSKGVIREFLEESVGELTEVRKEQVEVKREWKKVVAELEALEPKKTEGDVKAENGETDVDGDVSMSVTHDRVSPSASGIPNGTNTERDELEDSPSPNLDDDGHPFPASSSNPAIASRHKALKEKAAEREITQSIKILHAAQEKQIKAETKHLSSERKRLIDEEAVLKAKLHELEYDFRAWYYTLRARPLGLDRFGNRVWWFDGVGSCSLNLGKMPFGGWGTGRVFVQGVDEGEAEWLRICASGLGYGEVKGESMEERRVREEGEGRLGSGEWGVYDTPDQLETFMTWLSPRGTRETQLLKTIKQWLPEITAGMRRRRIGAGLEEPDEVDEVAIVRKRPNRKVAGGVGGEEEGSGHMGWKNRRAGEKS